MSERGRSALTTDAKKPLPRSRSRVRLSLKKMMKGIGRHSSKSVGDNGSLASVPTAVNSDITQPTASPSRSGAISSLQLVLLLLDPTTRRFELLQLEFDSKRARVADIIAQIPLSVTEDAIKKLQFEAVIGEAQEGKGLEVRLVDFCKEKQVLVALPKGLATKECIRLARPILNDSQVLKLLSNGGFELSTWAIAETPRSSAIASPTSAAAPAESDMSATSDTTSNKSKGTGATFTVFAVLAMFAIVIQAVNQFTMTPIQVGVVLAPGAKRSRCGLLGYLPKQVRNALPLACTHSFLEVDEDGTVSVFDDDRTLTMRMFGDVCSTEDCIDGVMMLENGLVLIGDKRIKKLSTYGNVDLTPFPFEIAPKLKVKKYNK